jgi:molecular chaperone HscC
MTQPEATVGIDLGTTYSLVGVLQGDAPLLLPNEICEVLTPSAVGIDHDGSLLVGEAARARGITHPELTARWFKRDMGTSRTHQLGKRTFRPEQLSAAVLAHLKRNAEAVLGVPVREAVVTVPAYFGDLQREATRNAGEIAGLVVERIINEPTAAALAYGLHQRDRELRAVVLDLGGGTFDVTVLEIMEGVIEIRSSAGDARLGGEDFVDALAAYVVARVRDGYGAPPSHVARVVAQVREGCERAKVRLTDHATSDVVLPRLELRDGREVDVSIALERDVVESVWRVSLARLRAPIHRALRDARVDPAHLDEVLLVGGATRMPSVVRTFAEILGRMPSRALDPDESVAKGAAIQAALKRGDAAVDDLVITDVAPFTLGIATGTMRDGNMIEGLMTPLIERGTVIPVSRELPVTPLLPGQSSVEIPIYQGEHPMCRDNVKLGTMTVKLPRGPEEDKLVRVRFTYDLNGILEVEAIVDATGKRQHLVIEERPGALTAKQVAAARAAMAKLKFHPREALPNRTAHARADAAYVRCSDAAARQLLQQAIVMFELALEGQAPAVIEQARAELNHIVAAIERA